jgi:rod shape-determining protein MreC
MAIRRKNSRISSNTSQILMSLVRHVSPIKFILVAMMLMFVLNANKQASHNIKAFFFSGASYFYNVISYPLIGVNNLWQSFRDYSEVIEENSQLKNEKIQLENRLENIQVIEDENKSLRRLLNVANDLKFNSITVRIISKNIHAARKIITINAGNDFNIREGSAVINANGLIGRVTQVFERSSEVLLLNDPQSKVPVRFSKSQQSAIAAGHNLDRLLEIEYLDSHSVLQEDDLVVSSSDGDVFPPDLMIGQVSYIDSKYYITAEMNWKNLDYVMVLLH